MTDKLLLTVALENVGQGAHMAGAFVDPEDGTATIQLLERLHVGWKNITADGVLTTSADMAEKFDDLVLTRLAEAEGDEPGWGPGEKHAGCYHAEHSCTQTDDERGALRAIVEDIDNGATGGERWENIFPAERDAIAEAVLAAGFRRSGVPEPSEERTERAPIDDIVANLAWEGYETRTIHEATADEPGEAAIAVPIYDAGNPLPLRVSGVEWRGVGDRSEVPAPSEGHGRHEFCDRRLGCLPEPQGEPSDAQVEAALSGWYRHQLSGGWDQSRAALMRAALSAAATAPERRAPWTDATPDEVRAAVAEYRAGGAR